MLGTLKPYIHFHSKICKRLDSRLICYLYSINTIRILTQTVNLLHVIAKLHWNITLLHLPKHLKLNI